MKEFIGKNDLLYSSQNGSTCYTGIFIDLRKAFDIVDHNILLNELHHHGFRGIINDWFASYLKNRLQTTQIGQHVSSKAMITCCVSQGSVLGQLLFLLYINDMHQCSSKFRFFLFADDTNLLYVDKNLKTLETVVNAELRNLCDWFASNKLTLNAKKSNFVLFHPYQKTVSYNPNIRIFDSEKNGQVSLESKDYMRYLGVIIDKNLPWKFHIYAACRQQN